MGRAIANVPEIRSVKIDAGLHDPIIQALGVVAARRAWRTPSSSRGSCSINKGRTS